MTFARPALSRCPACGALAMEVIETRQARQSTRRRKQCRSCGERCTTHEVSEEWFQLAQDNARLTTRLRDALLTATAEPQLCDIRCDSCLHDTSTGCSLDIPEHGTSDAHDCACWTPNTP